MNDTKTGQRSHFAENGPGTASKVVFLDIDGVLQPEDARVHLTGDRAPLGKLYKDLKKQFKTDYSIYSDMDVLTVYHLWNRDSVANLKDILDKTGAKIVLSSSWRIFPMKKMRDLFKLHGLDTYYIDNTMREDFRQIEQLRHDIAEYKEYYVDRVIEILEYLKKYPNITSYVAIDDINLVPGLENHFIHTDNSLTAEQAAEAVSILNGADADGS